MTEEKKITTILACAAGTDNKLIIPREDLENILEDEEIDFFQVHAEFDYFTKDEEGNIIMEDVYGEMLPKITRVTKGIMSFKIGVIEE